MEMLETPHLARQFIYWIPRKTQIKTKMVVDSMKDIFFSREYKFNRPSFLIQLSTVHVPFFFWKFIRTWVIS